MQLLYVFLIELSKNRIFGFKRKILFVTLLFSNLLACGGGSGEQTASNSTTPTNNQTTLNSTEVISSPEINLVSMSGSISFDFIPHNTFTNGLDYDSAYAAPAKGIAVEAVNAAEQVLAHTSTDSNGNFQLDLPASTDVRIRAYAQLISTEPQWNISVTDNTNSNALYAIQTSLASTGTSATERNLHAQSGWDGFRYSETRAAAPFAILDAIHQGLEKIVRVDSNLSLPALEVRWSPENRATRGDKALGHIGNSHYATAENVIYLLGSEDNDADEYDRHVIGHEFGHFLDFNLFRSDSIGGAHSLNESLDMRVAFGEGFANAFSAISLDDENFRDSLGPSQQWGFTFNIGNTRVSKPGWFNEASIQQFIYKYYNNNLNNFKNIFNVLNSDKYINSQAITSVHLFGSLLISESPESSHRVNALANENGFTISNIWGDDESNDGEESTALPIYKTLTLNGPPINVCSTNSNGDYNKHANTAFIKASLPSKAYYTINATRSSGLASSNPDFWVYQKGLLYGIADSDVSNSETMTQAYNAGVAVIALWDANNKDKTSGGGEVCFDVRISNE